MRGFPTDPGQLRDLFVGRIAADRDGFAPGTRGSNSRLYGAMCQLLVEVPDDEGRTGIGIELAQTFS